MLSPEGGSISLNGYLKQGNFVLEIINTGSGFSNEELKIRFEPYKIIMRDIIFSWEWVRKAGSVVWR